jgi:KDO2-lipid IV(A) lauroyltransferase
MARNQSALTNWSQYLALRLGAAAMHSFPVASNLAGACRAGSLMYRLDSRHRERAFENIRRCLPAVDERDLRRIVEGSMRHFMKLAVEVMFTPRLIQLDTWPARIGIERIGEAMDMILSDQPTIMVTAHVGNWEVLGYWMAMMGLDMAAIARPIDNPLINRWLLGMRQAKGLRIITKWGATDTMVNILQRGGTLAFIGDQNAGDKGMFVPFFGRLASAYKSIGLLAMRYNASILCGYARRVADDFRFEVVTTDIIHPADWADQPDPLYYITARYTRAIEAMVRLSPEQYFWLHRRWKSRPRHETLGKPMPAGLRRQLEALPWMDTPAIQQLDHHAA